MNAYDVNKNEIILRPLIEKALLGTVTWITNRCTPQEPDYVAALSTKFVKEFFNILVAVFPEYNFSVSSVYCHQKPIVDINMDKKPELGDVLFVYVDRREHGDKIINTLLLQAKISQSPFLRIQKSERHQLELYKKWPEFTYYRAGYLNGQKRNILPKEISNGAQYLLIDNNPLTNGICCDNGMFPMGCAMPDDIVCINNSLSEELINLLKFKSGRTIDNNLYTTEDGWSKMIWDLLKILAIKYTKRKNAGMDSFPRSNGCCHFSSRYMDNTTLLDDIIQSYDNELDISEENRGVSVVLVESSIKIE